MVTERALCGKAFGVADESSAARKLAALRALSEVEQNFVLPAALEQAKTAVYAGQHEQHASPLEQPF